MILPASKSLSDPPPGHWFLCPQVDRPDFAPTCALTPMIRGAGLDPPVLDMLRRTCPARSRPRLVWWFPHVVLLDSKKRRLDREILLLVHHPPRGRDVRGAKGRGMVPRHRSSPRSVIRPSGRTSNRCRQRSEGARPAGDTEESCICGDTRFQPSADELPASVTLTRARPRYGGRQFAPLWRSRIFSVRASAGPRAFAPCGT